MNIIEKIDLITKDKKELFNELSLEEFFLRFVLLDHYMYVKMEKIMKKSFKIIFLIVKDLLLMKPRKSLIII